MRDARPAASSHSLTTLACYNHRSSYSSNVDKMILKIVITGFILVLECTYSLYSRYRCLDCTGVVILYSPSKVRQIAVV